MENVMFSEEKTDTTQRFREAHGKTLDKWHAGVMSFCILCRVAAVGVIS